MENQQMYSFILRHNRFYTVETYTMTGPMGFTGVSTTKESLIVSRFLGRLSNVDSNTIPMTLHMDSTAALSAITKGYSKRLGHTPSTHQVSLSWMQEVFEHENRKLVKIPSKDNVADMLTKPLGRHKLTEFCKFVGLQDRWMIKKR
eukprot:Selendium_serpulae@DN3694_c0_g1_i1.p1